MSSRSVPSIRDRRRKARLSTRWQLCLASQTSATPRGDTAVEPSHSGPSPSSFKTAFGAAATIGDLGDSVMVGGTSWDAVEVTAGR